MVRQGDPVRFRTALFAPPDLREGLFALYAFNLEIAKIAPMVRSLFEGMSLDRGTSVAAAIARPLAPALRARALLNLGLAMPELSDRDHRRIMTGMVDHLTRISVEYLHLAELRDTRDRIATTGIEHLEAARSAGRGALLVSGHLGNWEAVRCACARLDWPPAIIYRRFNTERIDDEAQRRMRVLDAPIFHKGKRGTLGMLRHIRKGGAVMILSSTPSRTRLSPTIISKWITTFRTSCS